MGIRCLTTFVNQHFFRWRKVPVHGDLIIDGCSFYYEFVRDNIDKYGGNYVSLARDIENFLSTLIKCKIKPFLIFDGTIDYKKINTTVTRTQDKLKTAFAWTVDEEANSSGVSLHSDAPSLTQTSNNKGLILEPHLLSYTVIDTVKRVLGEDCLFVSDGDAEIDIASLAIYRQCPVLSNNSDFYIFPLLYGYIAYSKLYWSNPRNDEIYAELYFYELLCEQFGICDISLLAVIPAIIGNDRMHQLDAHQRSKILPPDPDCHSLIENVVMYTASFTTLEACIDILQKQQLIDPTAIIENIQEAYDDYFVVPCKFCIPLNPLKTTLKCINGLPLPAFVLKKFRVGVFSTFLIRILREQMMYKIVIEDLSESWCQLIGIPIRRAIYGILCGSNNGVITEYQRGDNPLKYDTVHIGSVTTVTYDGKKIPLPSLQSCGMNLEKDYGKRILFGILDVKEEDLKKIPTNHQLLLAITRYWYRYCTINRKNVLVKAFLLNLQQPLAPLDTTLSEKQESKNSVTISSAKPSFPVSSFIHAFAQWQSLYHDVYNLNQLLQESLILLPVSDFLECCYLHSLVEVVIKRGVEKVIEQNGLDQNLYLDFLSATCPT